MPKIRGFFTGASVRENCKRGNNRQWGCCIDDAQKPFPTSLWPWIHTETGSTPAARFRGRTNTIRGPDTQLRDIATRHQPSKVHVATSRTHNVQLSQPSPVPRPRRVVQLGQHAPHVRPFVRINQPAALDNFPQPLRKTDALRPLRFWWPITFHDRKYHPTVVCDVQKRNISAKDLTVWVKPLGRWERSYPHKPRI